MRLFLGNKKKKRPITTERDKRGGYHTEQGILLTTVLTVLWMAATAIRQGTPVAASKKPAGEWVTTRAANKIFCLVGPQDRPGQSCETIGDFT